MKTQLRESAPRGSTTVNIGSGTGKLRGEKAGGRRHSPRPYGGRSEGLMRQALELLGLQEADLRRPKKSEERKTLVGALVRERARAGNGWIARRLWTGDPSRVSRYCGPSRASAEKSFKRQLRRLEIVNMQGLAPFV